MKPQFSNLFNNRFTSLNNLAQENWTSNVCYLIISNSQTSIAFWKLTKQLSLIFRYYQAIKLQRKYFFTKLSLRIQNLGNALYFKQINFKLYTVRKYKINIITLTKYDFSSFKAHEATLNNIFYIYQVLLFINLIRNTLITRIL